MPERRSREATGVEVMGDISTLVGGPERAEEMPNAVRGLVTRPPADFTSSLFVIVPTYSGDYNWEVRQWSPRPDLPVKDTACLVVFDEHGDATIPVWSDVKQMSGGGGSTMSGLWRWTNTATAAGQIKVIGSSWAAATEVQVAKFNRDGSDTTSILAAIIPG